jgi:DNA-binding response OmpR family regulator
LSRHRRGARVIRGTRDGEKRRHATGSTEVRPLPTVLVVSCEQARGEALARSFPPGEFSTSTTADPGLLATITLGDSPDLVLVDAATLQPEDVEEVLGACRESHLPTLAVIAESALDDRDTIGAADEFLLNPPNRAELVARARRLLHRAPARDDANTVRVGDLVIDQTQYEVSVAGHRVLLTFKEYELLRLLASSPGRVFTRDELLSRVWGYDYFGGTRTVDVHIRRLRSKVEDARHTFIETVWGVGYRFRQQERER